MPALPAFPQDCGDSVFDHRGCGLRVRVHVGQECMTNEELIRRARAVINPRKIAHGLDVGDVGCALLTG